MMTRNRANCVTVSISLCAVVLLVVGSSISGVAHSFQITARLGETIYVDDNNTEGPWNGSIEFPYERIQNAVDNCTNGDTIFVFNGIYYENIWVNTSINLIGEDKNHTIIDGQSIRYCLFIAKNYVTVSGFTIQNCGSSKSHDAGVTLCFYWTPTTHYITITDNIIKNNVYGIFAWGSCDNVITHNLIINNEKDGIYFLGGDDNSNISENIITNNAGNGIQITEDCDNNLIFNNYIESNNASGICTSGFLTVIRQNVISKSPTGLEISGESQIEMNTIADNQIGLRVENTGNCLVKNNNFMQNSQHATFSYLFSQRIRYPFLVSPQLTQWRQNYWDNHQYGPKIIIGTMKVLLILPFPWVNFDFFAVNTPYVFSYRNIWRMNEDVVPS